MRSKLNASATARLPTEQGTAQAPGWPASESAPWALPALLQQQAPLQQDAAIANEARTVAARVGKTIPYGMETGKKSNELMALGAPLKKAGRKSVLPACFAIELKTEYRPRTAAKIDRHQANPPDALLLTVLSRSKPEHKALLYSAKGTER